MLRGPAGPRRSIRCPSRAPLRVGDSCGLRRHHDTLARCVFRHKNITARLSALNLARARTRTSHQNFLVDFTVRGAGGAPLSFPRTAPPEPGAALRARSTCQHARPLHPTHCTRPIGHRGRRSKACVVQQRSGRRNDIPHNSASYRTRPSSAATASRVPVKSQSMLQTSPLCTNGSAAASAVTCVLSNETRHTTTRAPLDTASSSHARPGRQASKLQHTKAQASNTPSFRAHATPEAAPPANVHALLHRRSSESNAQMRAGPPATPTASAAGRPGPCRHHANEVQAAPA